MAKLTSQPRDEHFIVCNYVMCCTLIFWEERKNIPHFMVSTYSGMTGCLEVNPIKNKRAWL